MCVVSHLLAVTSNAWTLVKLQRQAIVHKKQVGPDKNNLPPESVSHVAWACFTSYFTTIWYMQIHGPPSQESLVPKGKDLDFPGAKRVQLLTFPLSKLPNENKTVGLIPPCCWRKWTEDLPLRHTGVGWCLWRWSRTAKALEYKDAKWPMEQTRQDFQMILIIIKYAPIVFELL